jgi:hypothetical protein
MTTILATIAIATATPVPGCWVDAVQQVETGGQRNPDAAVGDGRRAKGRFQFHKEAWADCTKLRKAAGLPTHPYSKATDPVVAREYATTWLTYLRERLRKDIGRTPFLGEVWLAWNLGYQGFADIGFQLSLAPEAKFIKAAKLNIAVQ